MTLLICRNKYGKQVSRYSDDVYRIYWERSQRKRQSDLSVDWTKIKYKPSVDDDFFPSTWRKTPDVILK